VDKNGTAIILKNNAPRYAFLDYFYSVKTPTLTVDGMDLHPSTESKSPDSLTGWHAIVHSRMAIRELAFG
jgi:hypothetical protein